MKVKLVKIQEYYDELKIYGKKLQEEFRANMRFEFVFKII
jgi:hypothetical protein